MGRPNNRGVPQGPKFNVDVDEDDLWVGVNSQQLTAADSLMKDAMRSISQAQRDSLLAQKEAERDNPASTDHEIFEAVRFVNAITEVNNE